MQTKTITSLAIIFGVISVASLSVLATIGVVTWHDNNKAAQAAQLAAATPPPPPPAPTPQVAQVLAVAPHMVSVSQPKQSCWQQPHTILVPQQAQVPAAGAVIGGVAGGLAGSLIKGNAHEIAIGTGAALGALTGNSIQKKANQPIPVTRYVTKCSTTTTTKQKQEGYEVTYSYNGQQGMVIMSTPPVGNTLPLPITANTVTNPTS